MTAYSPHRVARLLVALIFSLILVPASFTHAARPGPNVPDPTAVTAQPASADTLCPAPADAPISAPTAAPGDTLPQPHIHPRDANGRLTDFTVAPGVTWHYDKPQPFRLVLTQNSNPLPAIWLEGGFCAFTCPIYRFSSGVSPRKRAFALPQENWKKIWVRTRPFRWALHIPRDLGQFPAYAFRRENTGTLIGLAVGSLALWVADQAIINWSQDVGQQLGLAPKSTQYTLVSVPFRIGSTSLPFEFNVPDNLNSTFYYLGDGWTHLAVAGSFWVYGGISKDNRALRTSGELGEAIFSTGLVVQGLKRITGRQSPYVATKDRGEWHLFPSYSRYQNFVPNNDAFPSGHLATAMATVTVIADNYPEYHFIRPVGYGLMGLLSYAMLNNGVHWASDYPIGIALGYAFGKIAVRNGRTRVEPIIINDPAASQGTGLAPPPKSRPWYRQGKFSPYNYGPFAGASWSLRW